MSNTPDPIQVTHTDLIYRSDIAESAGPCGTGLRRDLTGPLCEAASQLIIPGAEQSEGEMQGRRSEATGDRRWMSGFL